MVNLPPDLPPGLYERIVTERLRERLSALDARLVVRGPLDPADADAVLVRTVGEVLGRALRGIRGDGQERLAAQIALCNDVVAQLVRSVPQALDGPGDQVATPHEFLLALLVPAVPPAHPRPLPRPETPLSGWVEFGGILMLPVGYTEGGCPFGPTLDDLEPEEREAVLAERRSEARRERTILGPNESKGSSAAQDRR